MLSAFWTQSPAIGACFEPERCGIESDIMECNNPKKVEGRFVDDALIVDFVRVFDKE